LQGLKLTFLSTLSDACTSFWGLHILRNGHAYDPTIDILPIEPPDSGQCRLCILIHDGAITLGGACLFVAVDADLWFTGAVVQLAQKVQADNQGQSYYRIHETRVVAARNLLHTTVSEAVNEMTIKFQLRHWLHYARMDPIPMIGW
jgi:hypothetical protein